MIKVDSLFETHLTVTDLDRSVTFYRDRLELPLAAVFPERQVAFFWVGEPGGAMLGLWAGGSPQYMVLHTAFRVTREAVLEAPRALRAAGIVPLDFYRVPSDDRRCWPGCRRCRCTLQTRMATCSSFSRCSRTNRGPSWASSSGVNGDDCHTPEFGPHNSVASQGPSDFLHSGTEPAPQYVAASRIA
jgi:catechol 2,3-dioxygenase-like lactoylglutathione lyase family enzyme